MRGLREYLAELVLAGLCGGKPAPVPEGIEVSEIVRISGENHMNVLLLGALLQTKSVPEEWIQPMRDAVLRGMLRTGEQLQELRTLEERFEREQIRCQPMKGARMKFYYPSPELREMSDIDILIHTEDMERASVLLREMGYELLEAVKHHDIYQKGGIILEAHRAMYDRTVDEKQYAYFSDLSRAKPREGWEYVYDFDAEDFYIYLIAHMAKHFYKRGCGIRNLVDIYVYRKRFGAQMDEAYLHREFGRLGLAAFAVHMERLTRIWLGGETGEAFYDQLFAYMTDCGIYGKDENGIWNRFCEEDGRDLRRWYWFPPLSYMRKYYPWLGERTVTGRLLLPLAWGIRALRGISCGRGREKRRLLQRIEPGEISVYQNIYRRLELHFE